MLNVVDFQGNKRLDDAVLAEAIGSKSRLVYSPEQAEADVVSGKCDAVSFGRPYISNPDLEKRIGGQLCLRGRNRFRLTDLGRAKIKTIHSHPH